MYVSRTISRVMSLNGHLSRTAVAGSLKQPTRKLTGSHMLPVRSCFEWGLHVPPPVTRRAVVSYTALPPLPFRPQPKRRYISVALSLESPPPDVIWHPAL